MWTDYQGPLTRGSQLPRRRGTHRRYASGHPGTDGSRQAAQPETPASTSAQISTAAEATMTSGPGWVMLPGGRPVSRNTKAAAADEEVAGTPRTGREAGHHVRGDENPGEHQAEEQRPHPHRMLLQQ